MMPYSFESTLIKEGTRVYLKIPFNVWEVCGQKGLIPVRAEISGVSFECKLLPKGNGTYYLPVVKEVYSKIDFSEVIKVQFEFIRQLSRINSNSPYTKEKPIRAIDSITWLKQPQSGLCYQTCIAMLAGISVDEAIKVMKSKRCQASMGKVIETLDYFGFSYGEPVYTRGRKTELPKCCIVNVRGENKSRLMIHYDGKYYDPACGILGEYEMENIISYIEVGA